MTPSPQRPAKSAYSGPANMQMSGPGGQMLRFAGICIILPKMMQIHHRMMQIPGKVLP